MNRLGFIVVLLILAGIIRGIISLIAFIIAKKSGRRDITYKDVWNNFKR